MITGAAETLGLLDGEFLELFLEVLDVGHHTQQQVKNQRLHQQDTSKLDDSRENIGRSQNVVEIIQDSRLRIQVYPSLAGAVSTAKMS